MMIIISTLLLIIAVLHNVGELDAVGPSKLPDHLRPILGPNRMHVMHYRNREFGLWYDAAGKPSEVRLLHVNENIIPDEEYRRQHRVETRYVERLNVRFMVFLADGTIVGARYAPRSKDLDALGADWTFIHDDQEIGVWEDAAGKPRAVGLVPKNIIPTESERKKLVIRTNMEHKEGIFFLVHKVFPSGKIMGVELARGWNPPY